VLRRGAGMLTAAATLAMGMRPVAAKTTWWFEPPGSESKPRRDACVQLDQIQAPFPFIGATGTGPLRTPKDYALAAKINGHADTSATEDVGLPESDDVVFVNLTNHDGKWQVAFLPNRVACDGRAEGHR
jgi:hypothetical protein